MARPKKKSTTSTENLDDKKTKTLFDHVNQIRNIKNPKYFDGLTAGDRKSFNHYMICRFLSMDPSCITEVAYLCKVFDKMDGKSFYKVACALTVPVRYTPYIKSRSKKFNDELIGYISKKYEVSTSEAEDYCKIYMSTDEGIQNLRELCQNFGLTEKQIDKLLEYEN
jgi:hypothetical protein